MNGRFKRLAVILGAVLILAGGILATNALAETPTPTPATPAPAGQATPPSAQRTNYGQVFLSKLAAALGVDETKLNDSIKKAETDTIDQAVQNGDLAKNRADEMKQRIQQGQPGFLGPFGGRFGGGFGHGGWFGPGPRGAFRVESQTVQKTVADKLGMTVQDLQTQLKSGKSLSDIAKDKGVAEQDLRDAAAAAVKAQLDQAVKDGKLTQQQEDSILQRIQQGNLPGFFGPKAPKA